MKYIKLILLNLIFFYARGQKMDYLNPKINGQPLNSFIASNFRSSFTNRLDTLGIHGTSWVKFKISKDGSLKNVECSPGTHPVIATFLKEPLLKTNDFWEAKTEDQKKIESEWIILPVTYTLQQKGKANEMVPTTFELSRFFEFEAKPVQVSFLPDCKYTSPFDHDNNWGLEYLQKKD